MEDLPLVIGDKHYYSYQDFITISNAFRANFISPCKHIKGIKKSKKRVGKLALSIRNKKLNAVDDHFVTSSLESQKIIMWQEFVCILDRSIPHVVEFAKKIPGFFDLERDLMVICIKRNFFKVWLVHASQFLDPCRDTIFSGDTFISRLDMVEMFDEDFATLLFNFARWLNNMNLNESQIALYSAVVLIPTDIRRDIYEMLKHLQQSLIDTMEYHFRDQPHIFLSLISKLPEINALEKKHTEHLRWFKTNQTNLDLPPLFRELFDFNKDSVSASDFSQEKEVTMEENNSFFIKPSPGDEDEMQQDIQIEKCVAAEVSLASCSQNSEPTSVNGLAVQPDISNIQAISEYFQTVLNLNIFRNLGKNESGLIPQSPEGEDDMQQDCKMEEPLSDKIPQEQAASVGIDGPPAQRTKGVNQNIEHNLLLDGWVILPSQVD